MRSVSSVSTLVKNAVFLVLLPFVACAQDDDFDRVLNRLLRGDVEQVHPPMLEQNPLESTIFLDAREVEEFNVSHLPDALWVGYDDFDLTRLHAVEKDAPIVVYCSVGYRSERIARRLIKEGYTNVRNLYGGIFNWVNAGYSVVNDAGITDTVHTYNKKWSKWLKSGVGVYE